MEASMPGPFVSIERRVDLVSEFARIKSEDDEKSAASRHPEMKDPFEKKDSEKKDFEKKDLKEGKDEKETKDGKETKDDKEQELAGPAASDQAIPASMGDMNFDEAPSNMEIGQKWTEKPAKLIKCEP